MAPTARLYHVCKRCGPESWIFADRVPKTPNCSRCGGRWPKAKQDQWASNVRVWRDSAQKPQNQTPKPQRHNRQNQAQQALHTVWQRLPAEARAAIQEAGWQPSAPQRPPGLPQGRGQKPAIDPRTPKRGAGKGKGASAPAQACLGLSQSQEEVARSLFASVTGEQRDLLLQIGLTEPEEPQPDLTALCRQHINALPPAIQQLLEDPPEKPPTAHELVSETSRKFKTATVELREMILQKSALQLRIDKHKAAYAAMLHDMKSVDANLEVKQEQVTSLQQDLQSSVACDPKDNSLPDLESAFIKHFEAMEVDQIAVLREKMVTAIEEAAKRRQLGKPPDVVRGPRQTRSRTPPGERRPGGGEEACNNKE